MLSGLLWTSCRCVVGGWCRGWLGHPCVLRRITDYRLTACCLTWIFCVKWNIRDDPLFSFSDDFFEGGLDRARVSRAEHQHLNAPPGCAPATAGFTADDIKRLQGSDASLSAARHAANSHSDSPFFYQDGLLFHR